MKNKRQAHSFLFKRSGKLSLTDQENEEEEKNRGKRKWEHKIQRPRLYSHSFHAFFVKHPWRLHCFFCVYMLILFFIL